MILSRFFNTRSFVVAQRLSTLSKNSVGKTNLLVHTKDALGRRFAHHQRVLTRPRGTSDISMAQGLFWTVGLGVPIAGFGIYIAKDLQSLVEAEQNGTLRPNSKKSTKLSNDEWVAAKAMVQERRAIRQALEEAEEDEDDDASGDLEAVVESAVVEEEFVIVQSPSPTDEPIAPSEKDTVIFIDAPAKE